MQEAIKKSEVLIEALPYIKGFQEKVIVIKYGGSTMIDRKKRKHVLEDIVFMRCAGMYPVIVHGGGPFINKKLKKSKIRSKFIKGFRITDEKSLHIIKDVMSRINGEIVREIKRLGGKAQGFGRRNCAIKVKKDLRFGDIGYVGRIFSIDTKRMEEAFKKGAIPVLSPLGVGRDGNTYNVNADLVGASIAGALNAEKLALLTNVDGIMTDMKDKNSLISTLNANKVRRLLGNKKIASGMIPKVKACIAALRSGVKKVHIINGSLKHALLLEIFTDEGIGTEIIK